MTLGQAIDLNTAQLEQHVLDQSCIITVCNLLVVSRHAWKAWTLAASEGFAQTAAGWSTIGTVHWALADALESPSSEVQ